jgi:hypothetical protein
MGISNSGEVIEALQLLKLDHKILLPDVSKFVLKNVLDEFTDEKEYSYPLWEKIINYKSVQYKYAWELFSNILKDEKVILFFDFSDDKTMFSFEDGSVLTEVFENCFRFIFYLTNEENTFLLAFNDHDYLIGAGQAIKWIEDIKGGKI